MTVSLGARVAAAAACALLACGCGSRSEFAGESPGVREAPLFVYRADPCPQRADEAALAPAASEQLALVRFRAQGECSGAGGEYFVGREVGTTRDYFMGDHACYFFSGPPGVGSEAVYFGVVRYNPTAALFMGPTGWCIRDEDGREPVTSDSTVRAWAAYPTEAGAREAIARLRGH